MSATAAGARSQVLGRYRELLQLIRRLPEPKQGAALQEARTTVRARAGEGDPQKALDHLRELVSKIGFLRATTPKRPGEVSRGSGNYIMRDGKLVEGDGEGRGTR